MTHSAISSQSSHLSNGAPLATRYIGRFAPSPTGPLHFGSLIAALASYLDARAQQGQWLIRIEDLDPPREIEGSADIILQQLSSLGFTWDGQVLYQSTRIEAYEAALEKLARQNLCFFCNCTRARMQTLAGVYDGHCRNRKESPLDKAPYATRIQVADQTIVFEDRIQGPYKQRLLHEVGDFVIRRKDTFFAYQLAVIVDDEFQQITDVVRGFDLIDSTPRQIYLQRLLGLPALRYAHFPVAADCSGEKLSKQQHAQEIEAKQGSLLLIKAMDFLGLNPPEELRLEPAKSVLDWGISHWDIQNIPKLATINGIWT